MVNNLLMTKFIIGETLRILSFICKTSSFKTTHQRQDLLQEKQRLLLREWDSLNSRKMMALKRMYLSGLDLEMLLQVISWHSPQKLMMFRMSNFHGRLLLLTSIPRQLWKCHTISRIGNPLFNQIKTTVINTTMLQKSHKLPQHMVQLKALTMRQLI
jgi:hypothetical protein